MSASLVGSEMCIRDSYSVAGLKLSPSVALSVLLLSCFLSFSPRTGSVSSMFGKPSDFPALETAVAVAKVSTKKGKQQAAVAHGQEIKALLSELAVAKAKASAEGGSASS
eukprot:10406298-Alexandrium_andersonii.AAC.1